MSSVLIGSTLPSIETVTVRIGPSFGKLPTITLMAQYAKFASYEVHPKLTEGQVTSVTDPEFRCYELDLQNTAGATGTATVSAGSTIGFKGVDIHFDSRLRV